MRNQIVLSLNPYDINQNVVNYGLGIAKKLNLPLHLYAVQYTPLPIAPEAGAYGHYPSEEMPVNVRQKMEKKLKLLYEEIKKIWPQTSYEFEMGFMADTIVDKSRWLMKQAGERNPYLILMEKSHEYNWWNEVFGTTETAVASNAPCPVLILPSDIAFNGINRLMYLVDDNSFGANNVEALVGFAKAFDATIAAMYLAEFGKKLSAEDLDEKMQPIKKKAEEVPLFYYQFQPEDTAEEIMRIATWSNTDIVAFPFRETSFIKRIFNNENTQSLILKASVPVLVF